MRMRWLSFRLRRRMRAYNRFSFWSAAPHRTLLLLKLIAGRLLRTGRRKLLTSGGVLIAFVGPEATGKSTLTAECGRWTPRVER